MDNYKNIPDALQKLPQWVFWDKVWNEKRQKFDKLPKQKNGNDAKSNDPATWCKFEDALKGVYSHTGIGFVFQEGGEVVGIDLDNCFNEDGTPKDWAKEIVKEFPSYIEYSPSKKGLHIIFYCNAKVGRRKDWKNDKGEQEGIECYSHGRFFTFTGDVFEDYNDISNIPVEDFKTWGKKTFPEKDKKETIINGQVFRNEEDILNRVRLSRNGAKFQVLYENGDWKSLGFPSQSEADLALCSLLMFFCGNNTSQVDSIFRKGKLMRDKWDEYRGTQTYGQITLSNSLREKVISWNDASSDDTQDMLKSIKLYGEITIEQTNVGYNIRYPNKEDVIHCFVSELSQSRQSIECVIKIFIQKPTQTSSPISERIDIRSSSARTRLVTELNRSFGGDEKKGGYNWALIMNNVFTGLGDRITDEVSVQYLMGLKYEKPKFMLYPFLQEKAPNLLYAQSETGKGWLIVRMVTSLVAGIPIFGYQSEQKQKVLYIDYEDTAQIFAGRLHRVCAGLGLDYDEVAKNIPYINLRGSVRDNIEIVRRLIDKEKITLVVYDAGGDASGGSPIDEKIVIDFFNSIKTLNTTNLIIHHEPKRTQDLDASQAIYGSMYWKSLSRVGWRLEKQSEVEGESVIKMSQGKKSNLTKMDDIYYKVSFQSEAEALFQGLQVPKVTLEKVVQEEVRTESPYEQKESDDVLEYLKKGRATLKQIVDWTGQSESNVQKRVRKLFEAGKINKEEEENPKDKRYKKVYFVAKGYPIEAPPSIGEEEF